MLMDFLFAGADSPKLKFPTSKQLHEMLDHCHGLQEVKGSQHRKQKFSYATNRINPKDLDLQDASSEKEIESLPLKIEQTLFSVQGLASQAPQLDSSSREEMYYPRDPI